MHVTLEKTQTTILEYQLDNSMPVTMSTLNSAFNNRMAKEPAKLVISPENEIHFKGICE